MLHNCPDCGPLVRTHNKICRHCADAAAATLRRELAERAKAELEWAMVGEKPVNWESALALSAGAHKCDEAEYISRKTPGTTEVDHRLARMRAGRDD